MKYSCPLCGGMTCEIVNDNDSFACLFDYDKNQIVKLTECTCQMSQGANDLLKTIFSQNLLSGTRNQFVWVIIDVNDQSRTVNVTFQYTGRPRMI